LNQAEIPLDERRAILDALEAKLVVARARPEALVVPTQGTD
jgi:hypothetical protein